MTYVTDHSDDSGVVVVYMDKVDFDHEIGAALGGNRVYPSIKDLEKNQPCTKQCGIVEVEVRLKRVIRESDFSESIRKWKQRKQEQSSSREADDVPAGNRVRRGTEQP